ncbi:hypothetical protein B0H12DRAFT_1262675 [Mycena haematopus]|nr:hypothetical protein B0H12DRAFT_1262675 [Mycena haematopus]
MHITTCFDRCQITWASARDVEGEEESGKRKIGAMVYQRSEGDRRSAPPPARLFCFPNLTRKLYNYLRKILQSAKTATPTQQLLRRRTVVSQARGLSGGINKSGLVITSSDSIPYGVRYIEGNCVLSVAVESPGSFFIPRSFGPDSDLNSQVVYRCGYTILVRCGWYLVWRLRSAPAQANFC